MDTTHKAESNMEMVMLYAASHKDFIVSLLLTAIYNNIPILNARNLGLKTTMTYNVIVTIDKARAKCQGTKH